jgi:hypothetical protein
MTKRISDPTNAARLRELMGRHQLHAKDVARMCKVSIKAVESWLNAPGTSFYRAMPDMALELVTIKCARRRPAEPSLDLPPAAATEPHGVRSAA